MTVNGVPVSGRSSRESRRRAIEQARQRESRRRRLRLAVAGGVALILAGAGTGIGLAVSGGAAPAAYAALSTLGDLKTSPAPGPLGPEKVPVPGAPPLAGTSTAAAGQAIDGISCDTSEQTLFHVHAHLTIFVNGEQRQVPAAIGIPDAVAAQAGAGSFVQSGSCLYWLHTHAADGIIHVESPVRRAFTLGDFFDEWGQPLGPNQAGPARGRVTVIVDGQVFTGNPRAVALASHESLQVEVGRPLVAPQAINWTGTGL